jgi:hypothetical protein
LNTHLGKFHRSDSIEVGVRRHDIDTSREKAAEERRRR